MQGDSHRTRCAFLFCFLAVVFALGCSQEQVEHHEDPVRSATQEATTPISLTMPVPKGRQLKQFGLIGLDGITLEDRARAERADGGYAAIANTRSGQVTIGADTHSGSIVAVGNAFLRDRATVHGSLTLGGQRLNQSVWTVEGKQQTGVPLTTEPLNLVFQQPTTAAPLVRLEPGQTRPSPLPPGRYQGLDLKSRATLTLTAGQYFFGSVNIEPEANLRIQDSSGRVFLVVSNSLVVKAAFQRVGGGFPNLQIAYSGTPQATLTAPIAAWVIAPRALINLESMGTAIHEGAFFGKSIRVAPGVRIRHRPMPWLVQTVSVTPAQVCPGQSFEVLAQTADVGSPGEAIKVFIDRIPGNRYADQLFGVPGPREITVVAKGPSGLIDSQIATVQVIACDGTGPFPQLVVEEDLLEQDSVHVSVMNAAEFEDGTQRYVYDFGDGEVMESAFPSVTHDYTDSFDIEEPYRSLVLKVTVKRTGLADIQAARTVLIWNTYALTKTRGTIEPPTHANSESLRESGSSWSGSVTIGNREDQILSITSMRIDQVPCNGDTPVAVGTDTAFSRGIQGGGSTTIPLSIPVSSIGNDICGVQVHFFGSLSNGLGANSSASFEIPTARPGATTDPTQTALLQYVIENNLVSNPDRITGRELTELYRQRRIRYSIAQQTFYQSAPAPTGEECDPQDLSDIPGPGYTCLATTEFSQEGESYIANAYKGDAVLIHACGFVTDMFRKLDPPQKYSHSGIMIRNQDQLRHSTGQDAWLMDHGVGLGGLATEGIEENALRYFWPGPITATVPEAFEAGVSATSPEGDPFQIFGFNRNSARCPGDASIVFPRLMKPAPKHETSVRPRLHAAAEEAKLINGHYRFSVYSDATITGSDDPSAPSWGPQPTVCSAFVRQSLVNAGITVDADKSLPIASSVTPSTPDGLFHYTEAERLAAAEALAAWLKNMARVPFTEINDEYWWATTVGFGGGAAVVGWLVGGPIGGLIGAAAGAFVSIFVGPGDVVQGALDTPNKIANQFANCFASDFCALEANSSTAWREPGTGVALSPDDLMNHFDAPEQGGVYGYHEPMVYRTKRFRRIYRWEPPAGPAPRTMPGRVEANGIPAEDARIEIPSLSATAQSDASGRFSFEDVPFGPVIVHASKTIDSVFYEVERCFEPRDPDLWQELDCASLLPIAGLVPVAEIVLPISLPDPEFRRVNVTGTMFADDCDCIFPWATNHDRALAPLHAVCDVGPGQLTGPLEFTQAGLCADEVGLQLSGTCTLLDARTVRVRIDANFLNTDNNNGSCGGSSVSATRTFEQEIRPGESADLYTPALVDNIWCPSVFFGIPYECSSRATFSNVQASNEIAP